MMNQEVRILAGRATLAGSLSVPAGARALVPFAHGSGSSRHSPRNRFVARTLDEAGLATLLFDLLTREAESVGLHTAQYRLNIGVLAEQLLQATLWAMGEDQPTRGLRTGYFGASTGGGAALVAAAELPAQVSAVVSRGGQPDLAAEARGFSLLPLPHCRTVMVLRAAPRALSEALALRLGLPESDALGRNPLTDSCRLPNAASGANLGRSAVNGAP